MAPERGEAHRARSFRRDTIAWLVVLAVGGTVFAWWLWWPQPRLFTPRPPADAPQPLAVVAYGRIGAGPDGERVDIGLLRRHLEALAAAGFQPVTADQVADFALHGAPLPERPLLLLFEHGYSETVERVTPLLEALGWHAVVGIQTRRMAERDTAFVYWHTLEEMVASGLWSVALQGHASDLPLPVGPGERRPGAFFSHRAWLPGAGRFEGDGDYLKRLEEDLRAAFAQLEEGLPELRVRLFNYPGARPGGRLRLLAEQLLASRFDVALGPGPTGVNGPDAPRLRFQKLRPTAATGAEALVRHLRAASVPVDGAGEPFWIVTAGALERAGQQLTLEGEPLGRIWLAGSQWRDQWRIEAEITEARGQWWLTASSGDGEVGWRVGVADGRLRVQLMEQGAVRRTFAAIPVETPTGRLAVVKRGAGVWVHWNGGPVADRPLYLPRRWRRALVGWEVWDEAAPARLRLARVGYRPLPRRAGWLDAAPSTTAVQRLIDEAEAIAVVRYPAEVDYGDAPHLAETRQLLSILAHRYGWELEPAATGEEAQ